MGRPGEIEPQNIEQGMFEADRWFVTLFVAMLFLLALTGPAVTAEPASKTDATPLLEVGKSSRSAKLIGIAAQRGFIFQMDDGEETVPSDALVRWGHPVEPGNRTQALLTDGSLLVAADAWTVDDFLRLDDVNLTLATRRFGTVTIPRPFVARVILKPSAAGDSQRTLSATGPANDDRRLQRHDDRFDLAIFTNGDRVRGDVLSLHKKELQLQTAAGVVTIDPARVAEVVLRGGLSKQPPRPAVRRLLVGFRDGSLLIASQIVQIAEATSAVAVETLLGVELRAGGIDEVVFLQPLGEGVQYLSDVAPQRYRHVPFLDIPWPFHADRNVLGGVLRVGGNRYAKGVGVHSAARLVYKLDGTDNRFAAEVAIDEAAGRRGSAVFRVFLAKDGKWKEAYQSSAIRGGDPAVPVAVPLDAANGLALVVDYADYGDERDYANWLDARLEKME